MSTHKDMISADAERRERVDKLFNTARSTLKYGILKLSARRFAVIEYRGPSYCGDIDAGTGYFKHSFTIVEDGNNLTWSAATTLYEEYVK